MTKFVLILYMCSMTATTCMPPYQMPKTYSDIYTCFLDGYQKSIDKLIEIGKDDVNQFGIFVRFECKEINVKVI